MAGIAGAGGELDFDYQIKQFSICDSQLFFYFQKENSSSTLVEEREGT